MTEHERSYCVVALEPVQHAGRQLGHVRRVFYRCDDLPSDKDTVWQEQGYWEDDERWASNTTRGQLFFQLLAAAHIGVTSGGDGTYIEPWATG